MNFELFGENAPSWFGDAAWVAVFLIFLFILYLILDLLNVGKEWGKLVMSVKAFRLQELRNKYLEGIIGIDKLFNPIVAQNKAVANSVKSQVESVSVKFDEDTDPKVVAIAESINALLPDIDWDNDGKPDVDVSPEEVARVARYLRDLGFEFLDEDVVTLETVPLPPGLSKLSAGLQSIPPNKRFIGG